jgi:hypothetical protein
MFTRQYYNFLRLYTLVSTYWCSFTHLITTQRTHAFTLTCHTRYGVLRRIALYVSLLPLMDGSWARSVGTFMDPQVAQRQLNVANAVKLLTLPDIGMELIFWYTNHCARQTNDTIQPLKRRSSLPAPDDRLRSQSLPRPPPTSHATISAPTMPQVLCVA